MGLKRTYPRPPPIQCYITLMDLFSNQNISLCPPHNYTSFI